MMLLKAIYANSNTIKLKHIKTKTNMGAFPACKLAILKFLPLA